MTQTIDSILRRGTGPSSLSGMNEPVRDVLVVLVEALGPAWSVRREIDYEGEVSIIVLPVADETDPGFLLYEKEGLACVATITGDDWVGDQGFATFQEAISAIITKISERGNATPQCNEN